MPLWKVHELAFLSFGLFRGHSWSYRCRGSSGISAFYQALRVPILPALWHEASLDVPPGTKPIHAGKNSWGINFCANTCGACIRMSANTGNYFWGIIFEICIRTLAPALCIDIVPVFAHPWCQYKKKKKIGGGIDFGANTCGTCIHTRANTGKYFWRIIYVLVSCQGVLRESIV